MMSLAKRPKSLPLASAACALPFAFHCAPIEFAFYICPNAKFKSLVTFNQQGKK
jgi:hypothetical protein